MWETCALRQAIFELRPLLLQVKSLFESLPCAALLLQGTKVYRDSRTERRTIVARATRFCNSNDYGNRSRVPSRSDSDSSNGRQRFTFYLHVEGQRPN